MPNLATGGSEGIRTPEEFDPLPAFQASALGHYATLPLIFLYISFIFYKLSIDQFVRIHYNIVSIMFKQIAYFIASLICLTTLDRYVDTISLGSDWTKVAALLVVLTLLNWFVLPFFKFITFPFNLISFGLVGVILNYIALHYAIQWTQAIDITNSGTGYFLNLALISFTLTAAQMIVNRIIPE
jgi:uncharacterized membrane protein YvlD (DUF360 family)